MGRGGLGGLGCRNEELEESLGVGIVEENGVSVIQSK